MEEGTRKKETPSYKWQDITAEFKYASSKLALGELMHDSS